MSAFNCQHPDHQGDRTIRYRQDRMERRIEFRNVHDQSRFKTRKVAEVCRACALREVGELDRGHFPSVQGAML